MRNYSQFALKKIWSEKWVGLYEKNGMSDLFLIVVCLHKPMVTTLVYVSKLQARKELSMEVSKISTEEVVIGNTTYVVKTNAKNVSPEFVKKTIKKILFGTLKQKS